MQSQAAERHRLLKLLETANIKLASVATDVFGVSGPQMLRALVEGQASLGQKASELTDSIESIQKYRSIEYFQGRAILTQSAV